MQWNAGAIFNVLTLRALTPRIISMSALELMRQSAAALHYASTDWDARAAWIEFQNKIEAFSLFEYVDFELGVDRNASLQDLVLQASRLDSYRSVWAMEGLGHYCASLHCRSGQFPARLFSEEHTRSLPPGSLIPLHTGMGLALAENVLGPAAGQPENLSGLIDTFTSLCRDNAQEGYAGAVFEALGLVARTLYPGLIEPVQKHLSRNETLLAYFWHGVGRGSYFNVENFPPFCSALWNSIDVFQNKTCCGLGRRNMLSGLGWALTLVNIRHPEVMETFLKHHGAQVATDEVFANGVSSALVIWRQISPQGPYIKALQSYVPRNADAAFLELWNYCVTQSCDRALSYQESLPGTAVSEVFRYQ